MLLMLTQEHLKTHKIFMLPSTIEAFKNGVVGPAKEMKLLFKAWGFDLENIKCPVTIWQGTLDREA